MPRRRIIGLLALLAVLLHASAVVRHAVVAPTMLAADSQIEALIADLGVICHTDVSGKPATVPDAPTAPKNDAGNCPICLGLVAAVVLDATAPGVLPPATGPPVRLAVSSDFNDLTAARGLLPPARGPPCA